MKKKRKKEKIFQLENKLRNKYFHYLQDQDYGFSIFPVYKTFESNPLHFDNNIISSLFHMSILS
ncbi:hypothetical protein PFLG_00397 [Plasmodium falciparum RAJ116]|uniref:Uncharacterized protein n=1 Tax=Plasmodium falciparum RAJ116 TaxID=580058 RepID=A0A0L0CSV9_PLAFA|nr:hypothetical protein PFLG_00397 [Plasmodium falciparum RAJ116]